MAEKLDGKAILIKIVLIFMLSLLAMFLFAPTHWMSGLVERERNINAKTIGAKSESMLAERAYDVFDALFIKTGIHATSGRIARNPPGGNMLLRREGYNTDVAARINAVWTTMYLAIYRMVALLAWVFGLAPVLVAAVLDGWATRQANRWKFSLVSVLKHTIFAQTAFWLFALCLVYLIAPFPTPTLIAPALAGLGTVSLWGWVASMKKRL